VRSTCATIATWQRSARLVAVLVVCALASPAQADLRYAMGNDVFTELDQPIDDDGFTHETDIRFWRSHRGYQVGGRLFDRWITEVPRSGGRRRDLVELVATLERTWQRAPGLELTVGGRAGPSFTGNLAGRWMQDGFHRLCNCGDSLEQGLQSRYEGDNGFGALVGSRVRGAIGVPVAQAYGVIDGQAVLGAGVTWIDAGAGGRLAARIGCVELAAHAELAVMRYHAADERLAIPGGYGTGWQTAYRVGFHVAWSRYRVEYQYRANESGSGEPIGIIAFTVKQAGTRF